MNDEPTMRAAGWLPLVYSYTYNIRSIMINTPYGIIIISVGNGYQRVINNYTMVGINHV